MQSSWLGLVLSFLLVACSDAKLENPAVSSSPVDGGGVVEEDGGLAGDAGDSGTPSVDGGEAARANLRVVAGNLSSGTKSNYDSGEGIRIFRGLNVDVALVQEFNYGTNSDDDLKDFVSKAFGSDYSYFREPGVQIPNGVVSRYPILESGHWVDSKVDNRSFVYAKIDVPGPHALWAVSLHLLTSSAGNRASEASALVAKLGTVVGSEDYVVLGGDFNTAARTESCITTFAQIADAPGALPVDQRGNDATNAPRNAPYDWVLAGKSLAKLQVPTVIGERSFSTGLVFDSRVYTPLADVAPVQATDSAAQGMQHMAVVKDFAVPE